MRPCSAILAVVAFALMAAPAFAQTNELESLAQEIRRLRADMDVLQRHVFADGSGAGVQAADPDSSQIAAQNQLAAQSLDERLRELIGRVEELEHRQRQLPDGVEQRLADLELRLAALESGDVAAPSAAPVPAIEGEPEAVDGLLPDGTEMEQYNYAFALLRKAEYDSAAAAFEEFITLNPESDLVGNAYFWLGSTHFVRDMFRPAAVAFLRGYQAAENGPKAPNNLYKLGATLARLNRAEEACAAFREARGKFPQAYDALEQASGEAAQAGCG